MPQTLPLYQIDAFTRRLFGGNPAAIVPLDEWLADELLQSIAAENNLAETAFLVPDWQTDADYALRWFTPTTEVELCGHATLASAFYVFEHSKFTGDSLRFASRSGTLTAQRAPDGSIRIDLPARPSQRDDSLLQPIAGALGCDPVETWRGANAIAFFDSTEHIRQLRPDFRKLAQLHPLGLIATAPGEDCDFVSRYFAPSFGIDEDPVTGSAHADLMPLWTEKLGRASLQAQQLSARGGELLCQLDQDRVLLTGHCVMYLRGDLFL